jgi:hypothetical protein
MISDMDTPISVSIDEEQPAAPAKPVNLWGAEYTLVACSSCGWGYLAPAGSILQHCPHCYKASLSPIQPLPEGYLPQDLPPELVFPFTLSTPALAQRVQEFTNGIPYPPGDLSPANLQKRLQRVFIPAWLVDAGVRAGWQAETGFNYEVVSHQERYSDNQGGWRTQEVKETRVRWEPRLGKLERKYHNISLPAVEREASLEKSLGGFEPTGARPYAAELAREAFIRLPARSRQDAWPDALPRLQNLAAEECRQAASADHLRDFRWSPEFGSADWTLLLQPLYSTYYLDDDGQPRPVYLNGQTGAVSGVRRASPKRARGRSLTILIVAAVIFMVSLLLALAGALLPPLLAVGGVGLFAGVVVAFAAAVPAIVVWQFNRSQDYHI